MTTSAQSIKIRGLYNEARHAGLLEEDSLGRVTTEGIFPGPIAMKLRSHEEKMSTKQASDAIGALAALLRKAQKPDDALAGISDADLVRELTSRLTDKQIAALLSQHTNLRIA